MFSANLSRRGWTHCPNDRCLTRSRASTGISVAILEKQVGELRRRLNAPGISIGSRIRPRWASQLRLDLAGTPERNEANVIIALSNDEAFAGALVFDEFRQEILVARALPWDQQSARCRGPGSTSMMCVAPCGCSIARSMCSPVIVSRSVTAVAREIRDSPGARLLTALRWDGVPRLDTGR